MLKSFCLIVPKHLFNFISLALSDSVSCRTIYVVVLLATNGLVFMSLKVY